MCSPETFPRGHAALFGIILITALALRVVFYQGPAGADDMIYFSVVEKLLAGQDAGRALTTAGHWGARTGMVLPHWGIMKVLGVSEAVSMVYPMVLSTATMILLYFFGLKLFGPVEALIALAAYAVLPLDVHYAGLMYPDGPVVFFSFLSLTLLFLISRSTRFSPFLPFLAGVSLGLGYCIRETSILLFIALPLLFLPAKNKLASCKSVLLFGFGFGLVLAAEMVLFAVLTSDPLARFHILTQKTQVLTPHQYPFVPRFHSYFWDGVILLFATYWLAPLLLPLALLVVPFIVAWMKTPVGARVDGAKLFWIAILALSVLLFYIYAPVIGFTKPLERDERYYLLVMPLFALLFGVMAHRVFRSGTIGKLIALSLLMGNIVLSMLALGCITNKNIQGLNEIHSFIQNHKAARHVLPDAFVLALRLKDGAALESAKIASYRYGDDPIILYKDNLRGETGYLYYLPEIHRIQSETLERKHWPPEYYTLREILPSDPSPACRLLRATGLVELIPEFFTNRICFSPDVHVYEIKQPLATSNRHE